MSRDVIEVVVRKNTPKKILPDAMGVFNTPLSEPRVTSFGFFEIPGTSVHAPFKVTEISGQNILTVGWSKSISIAKIMEAIQGQVIFADIPPDNISLQDYCAVQRDIFNLFRNQLS